MDSSFHTGGPTKCHTRKVSTNLFPDIPLEKLNLYLASVTSDSSVEPASLCSLVLSLDLSLLFPSGYLEFSDPAVCGFWAASCINIWQQQF